MGHIQPVGCIRLGLFTMIFLPFVPYLHMKAKHLHTSLWLLEVCIGRWSSHCQSIYLKSLSVRSHQSWRLLGFFLELHNWARYTPLKLLYGPSCYCKLSPIDRRGRPPLCQSSGQSHLTIWLRLERKQLKRHVIFKMFNKNIVIGHSLKLNGASLSIPLLITPLLFAFN